MLLAIDCGNTNTVFSIWDGIKFISNWRIATSHKRTADQYYVWLTTLMELDGIKNEIDEMVILLAQLKVVVLTECLSRS